jgi:spermidine/putrescine-binding protein
VRFLKILIIIQVLIQALSCSDGGSGKSQLPVKVTLRIHAWNGYVTEYTGAFKKFALSEHGLDVDVVYTATSGYESHVENIKAGSKADVISPSSDYLIHLMKGGLVVPIDTSRLKNFNQINPVILGTGSYLIDGTAYAVPFNFGPYAIAYNRDKVQEPKSYKIFWDKRYSKRVSIPGEYDTINIYMAALMLGIPAKNIFNLTASQLAAVELKLKELCTYQVKEFWTENLNPESRNDIDIAMDWGIGVNQINQRYKGNWGFIIPEEGATGWIDAWSITKNALEYDVLVAAYAWIDFMISAEVQAQMARVTSYGPVNPYAGRHLSAEEKKMYYLSYPDFVKKIILWQPLEPSVLKRYRETWKRAKR